MSERRVRSTKAVNYAALDAGLSDDEDFVCFTPPAKKKKEPVKKKARTKVKENEENSVSSKKKSPKQRPTLEERKFKRELEIALKLSTTDGNESLSDSQNSTFKGFGSDLEGKKIVLENIHRPIPDSELNAGPITLSNSTDECTITDSEVPIVVEVHKYSTSDDEPAPSTSEGLTEKRDGKKVSFIKDDDSDEDDEDEISENIPSSDTDEDFCLSPRKKRSPQISKTNRKKCTTNKRESRNCKSELDKNNLKKIQLEPVASKLTTLTDDTTNPPNDNEINDQTNFLSTKQKISPKFKQSKFKTLTTSVSTVMSSIKTPPQSSVKNGKSENLAHNGTGSKCSIGLVKTPFKSPSIGGSSSSSPSTGIIQSTSNSLVKTGLRLGLSRRGHFKPLHPNVLSQ